MLFSGQCLFVTRRISQDTRRQNKSPKIQPFDQDRQRKQTNEGNKSFNPKMKLLDGLKLQTREIQR